MAFRYFLFLYSFNLFFISFLSVFFPFQQGFSCLSCHVTCHLSFLFPFFLLSFLNNLYYISISSLIPLSCLVDHLSLIDGVPKIVCTCSLYLCMSVHSFPTGFLTRFRGSAFSIEYKSLYSPWFFTIHVNICRVIKSERRQINCILLDLYSVHLWYFPARTRYTE